MASSRSFGAVNQEQFYVSISRGRERCQIFTDDAELLGRRVAQTHNRTAAVELLAFRQELARLGFARKEAKPAVAISQRPEQNERKIEEELGIAPPVRTQRLSLRERVQQSMAKLRQRKNAPSRGVRM